MPWTSEHTKWLVDTGERLKTADGKDVEVWEFCHVQDDTVFSAWAKRFLNYGVWCLTPKSTPKSQPPWESRSVQFLKGASMYKMMRIVKNVGA